MQQKAIELLVQTQLFSGVSEKHLCECLKEGFYSFKILASGESTIVKNSLAIVISGILQAEKTSEGKRIYLKKICENEITGIATLFDKKSQYISTLSAKKDSELLFLSEEFVKALISKSPEFSQKFICLLCEKIRYLNSRIDSCTKTTAEEKVFEFIRNSAKSEEDTPFIEMSMSSLSSALGLGRASLYRALAALEESGKISKNGKKIYLLSEV